MPDSLLTLSDEDFLRDGPALHQASLEEDPEPEELPDSVPSSETENTEEEESEPESTDSGDEATLPTETDPEEAEGESSDEASSEEETEPEGATDNTEADSSGSKDDDLKSLLAPFKAGGKQVQARSVAEALQLQQLGAHYTQRMQALKPNLRHLKTLEKNGLLDEDKLNYLIDLSNKDPKAIARLIKESEINPVDLVDSEISNAEYTPKDHHVTEKSMQLEEVLQEIESTPTYSKCIDLIGNQWDKNSQAALTGNPVFIRELNEQMQSGIFDKIQSEVDRVKMYGGLQDVSSFEAYRQVGAQMYQRGEFNPAPQQRVPVATTTVKPQDAARSEKRRAATPSKQAATPVKAPELNPLAMPDEEFLRIHKLNL